jgi:uncharacterized protein (DUF58 family)
MTFKAQLFAIAGLMGLFLGLVRGQPVLSLLSLWSLLWLVTEWFLFSWHVRFQLPKVELHRFVNGEKDANRSLWAERLIEVRVQLAKQLWLYGVTLDVEDVIPENLELIALSPISLSPNVLTRASVESKKRKGRRPESRSWLVRGVQRFMNHRDDCPANEVRIGLGSQPAEWGYSARVRAAGNVVFPGFRLMLQSTHQLFRIERFVKVEQSFRALPTFVEAGEYRSLTKKSNVIPRHGVHRLLRSGMGSELLELKEYAVGDPFKSIAWKVSAKRDQWMTRQYESEVPTRVQLIVDGSSNSRVGGFGFRLLDQMTFVAASVARMATNAGDPVGGVLIDDQGIRRLPSTSGEKGFQLFLRSLGDFSVNPCPPPSPYQPRMLDAAWALLNQRYPELLDLKINHFPFSLFPMTPRARTRRRQRFLVAGALAEIYSLSVREHATMIHDDAAFGRRLQHLLNKSGIPWIAPLIQLSDRRDREPIERMANLGKCILSVVGHARDNEVIVVMSDLLNCVGILEFVLPAVKLAIAKHHRVSFVCPTSTFLRPSRGVAVDFSRENSADELLIVAEQARLRIQAEQLQRELQRCGASLSLSGEKNAIHLIMSELDSVKSGNGRLQGSLR